MHFESGEGWHMNSVKKPTEGSLVDIQGMKGMLIEDQYENRLGIKSIRGFRVVPVDDKSSRIFIIGGIADYNTDSGLKKV